MTTTPIWALVTTSFGGLLTLIGVMITQRYARLHEDARWRREGVREKDLWVREDAARSYEHRRAAYVDFIQEWNRRWNAFIAATDDQRRVDHDMLLAFHQREVPGGRPEDQVFLRDVDDQPPQPPPGYLGPLYDCLLQIQVFGTEEAAKLAADAYMALFNRVFFGNPISVDVLGPLRCEVRRDLSIRPLV